MIYCAPKMIFFCNATSACSTGSFSQDSKIWRVLTTTNVRNIAQGQGVPEHKASPISCVQHVQVFCHFFLVFRSCSANSNKM